MSKPLRIALWSVVIILIPALAVVAISLVTSVAHASHKHPAYNCDSHTYKFGVGVSPYSGTTAHARVKAHACYWTKRAKGNHYTGQIIRNKTTSTIKWERTGFGQSIGFSVWNHEKYRTVLARQNPWTESIGHWSQFHQCYAMCFTDTGNFVPFWEYNSPFLIKHSALTRSDRWNWHWHEGEPGKDAKGEDFAIKFTCWCW